MANAKGSETEAKRARCSLSDNRNQARNHGAGSTTWAPPCDDRARSRNRSSISRRPPDVTELPYDGNTVVVDFANVGARYGSRVLGRIDRNFFDWQGIRSCVVPRALPWS